MPENDESNLLDKGMSLHERALPFLVLMKVEPTIGFWNSWEPAFMNFGNA